VLEPVSRLSDNTGDRSNLVIEGDNLQVMASLRAQFQNSVDVVVIDPPYNTGKNDFRYSDRRFQDPDADANDAVYVSNEDGGRHTIRANESPAVCLHTAEILRHLASNNERNLGALQREELTANLLIKQMLARRAIADFAFETLAPVCFFFEDVKSSFFGPHVLRNFKDLRGIR
jgi:predicted RNA methylase